MQKMTEKRNEKKKSLIFYYFWALKNWFGH